MLDVASIISLFVGIILPVLVAAVTKSTATAAMKSVLLVAGSVISAFLAELLGALNAHAAFGWQAAAITALGTFVVGVASHYGLWKPTGTADAVNAIGGVIGGPSPVPPSVNPMAG